MQPVSDDFYQQLVQIRCQLINKTLFHHSKYLKCKIKKLLKMYLPHLFTLANNFTPKTPSVGKLLLLSISYTAGNQQQTFKLS